MQTETLEYLVDSLNEGNRPWPIFLFPLTSVVDYAQVWEPNKDMCGAALSFFRIMREIYFIKDSEGRYVGAVYVMGDHDMHSFVKPLARRQGHLCSALNNAIFHDLHHRHRRCIQNASFQDAQGRHHLVEVMGFSVTKEISNDTDGQFVPGRAELSLEQFAGVWEEHFPELSLDDFMALKGLIAAAFQRIDFTYQYLRHVGASDNCPELACISGHLTSFQQAVDTLLRDRFGEEDRAVPVWLSDKLPDWTLSMGAYQGIDDIRKSLILCLDAMYLAVLHSDCHDQLSASISNCRQIARDDDFPSDLTYMCGPLERSLERLMNERPKP